MGFRSTAKIEDLGVGKDGRPHAKLLEDLVYETNLNGGTITVPKGYISNYASTPRLLWSIFPPWGEYNRAAILHDYLCDYGECSRFQTDSVFREAMAQLGVPTWRRVIMYYAVRIAAVLTGKR